MADNLEQQFPALPNFPFLSPRDQKQSFSTLFTVSFNIYPHILTNVHQLFLTQFLMSPGFLLYKMRV